MKIYLNGKEIEVSKGDTVLQASRKAGMKIPSLCSHPDLKERGSCRLCLIKIEGRKGFTTACNTLVEEGMKVESEGPEIDRLRRINLELLFSQHEEECDDCVWNPECKLLNMARDYKVKINRYPDRKKHYPYFLFGKTLEYDAGKCIDCRNCIEVCKNQGVNFLEMRGKGHLFEVFPSKENDCIYCGQCILHCPAGAFESVGEFEKIEEPLKNKNKTIVFQIAPAVRVSIGEEFGIDPGEVLTEKLVAGLKKVGADYVFDVSLGADFTTLEESKELLEKVKEKELPMFTSCCPAWVKFIEYYYPEMVKNLTTVKSPHILMGGLIKKKWAKNEKDVIVVSVMPCIAKKYEIERESLGRIKPVDYVLTVREVGRLFRDKGINIEELEGESPDSPFSKASSEGIKYGVSGGVMRAALKEILKEDVLVEPGEEPKEIEIEGKKVKVAIASGLKKGKEMIEKIKEDPDYCHYLEVMACPGGCVGGGGQPIPSSKEIVKKRKEALIEAGKVGGEKTPSEKEEIMDIYSSLKEKERKKLFHTKFKEKRVPEWSKVNKKIWLKGKRS